MQKRRVLRKHFNKWSRKPGREANFLKAEYACIPSLSKPRNPRSGSSKMHELNALNTHQGYQVDTIYQLVQGEARLDSVLWKTGFTRSILEAKLRINHGRVRVNQTRVSLPGLRLYPGDLIQYSFSPHKNTRIGNFSQIAEVDHATDTIVIVSEPQVACFQNLHSAAMGRGS